MTAEFDWSGAPEGERWVVPGLGPTHTYVIAGDGTVYVRIFATKRWEQAAASSPADVRNDGTRVESARPVPRVGDRVRVTIEGTVLDARADGLETDSFEIAVGGEGRRFFWPSGDGAVVEVLQRADPPLQPGDLVRDRDVCSNELASAYRVLNSGPDGRLVFREIDTGTMLDRDQLTGPLVKVELREVQP